MNTYKNVDEYISNFPSNVQEMLKTIRKAIKDEVPEIEEKISYGIPSATLKGKSLIYFAGYKNHVSIYPITPAVESTIKEIMIYRTGKGTLQFPIDKPLPISLILKVIKVMVKERKMVENSK